MSATDYRDVRKALWNIRPQWRNIGLELGFQLPKINELEQFDSFEQKFDEMVELWLKHTYSTPTWGALVTALRDVTVNGGNPVAAEIEAKHGGQGRSIFHHGSIIHGSSVACSTGKAEWENLSRE